MATPRAARTANQLGGEDGDPPGGHWRRWAPPDGQRRRHGKPARRGRGGQRRRHGRPSPVARKKFDGLILPHIIKLLKEKSRELSMEVSECSEEVAEVTALGGSGFRFVVNLVEQTCSCRQWQRTTKEEKIKPQPIKIPLYHGRMKLQLLLCPFHHQVKPWRVRLVQRENAMALVLKFPKAKAWTFQVQTREIMGTLTPEPPKEDHQRRENKTTTNQNSIVPWEDETPTSSMSFPPPSQTLESTTSTKRKRHGFGSKVSKSQSLDISSTNKGNHGNSNSGASKRSRSGSNQPHDTVEGETKGKGKSKKKVVTKKITKTK
uniref:Uncharacterized protein n=1 Tax=Oryza meridionalis TaxID=40149 RepID=A0A0E0E6V9_9ORYZ